MQGGLHFLKSIHGTLSSSVAINEDAGKLVKRKDIPVSIVHLKEKVSAMGVAHRGKDAIDGWAFLTFLHYLHESNVRQIGYSPEICLLFISGALLVITSRVHRRIHHGSRGLP